MLLLYGNYRVWQGSIPVDMGPGIAATRCMVQLSPGGSDAVEMREFDLVQKRFITPKEGGFFLPPAKSDAVHTYVRTYIRMYTYVHMYMHIMYLSL